MALKCAPEASAASNSSSWTDDEDGTSDAAAGVSSSSSASEEVAMRRRVKDRRRRRRKKLKKAKSAADLGLNLKRRATTEEQERVLNASLPKSPKTVQDIGVDLNLRRLALLYHLIA